MKRSDATIVTNIIMRQWSFQLIPINVRRADYLFSFTIPKDNTDLYPRVLRAGILQIAMIFHLFFFGEGPCCNDTQYSQKLKDDIDLVFRYTIPHKGFPLELNTLIGLRFLRYVIAIIASPQR